MRSVSTSGCLDCHSVHITTGRGDYSLCGLPQVGAFRGLSTDLQAKLTACVRQCLDDCALSFRWKCLQTAVGVGLIRHSHSAKCRGPY